MINKTVIINAAVAAALAAAPVAPAFAQMPQTDVAFVETLQGKGAEASLEALALYYDLHVSEIQVQLTRESNTGAFLAARRAEGDGDQAEVKRQMVIVDATKAELDAARQINTSLRQQLNVAVGADFGDDLVMAPDAPEQKPVFSKAPADLAQALDAAWAKVEAARAHLKDVRLKLLKDQERYDKHRDVPIGDSMRDMTRAEVEMARAACDLRLAVANIAVKGAIPLKDALGGL